MSCSRLFFYVVFYILTQITFIAQADETGLSMTDAVNLSINRGDPTIQSSLERADGIRSQSLSQSSLPDPKVKIGVNNIAAHSFDFNQEPMSQFSLGLHQDIPSGTRRRLIREQGIESGHILDYQSKEQQLLIIRDVRQLWLELLYLVRSKVILKDKEQSLNSLIKSQEEKYMGGKSTAQDLLLLEAEIALLSDKQEDISQKESIIRLRLNRYIGDIALAAMPTGDYLQLHSPDVLTLLEDNLQNHPALLHQNAKIRREDKAIGLVREDYKPNWGVDLGYGFRGNNRSDLLTAMVTFDVPLFTENRQDKKLYAVKKSKQAAEFDRQAIEEDMRRNLRISYVKWQRLSKRLVLYETNILKRTSAAASAAEQSYATGNSSYDKMIRIFLSEQDVRLKIEEMKMMQAQSLAELDYFKGDIQ